ncbi:hypothetical protein EDB83DRAFT_2438222 [Lactarius deliciosus]|nr:hypothetical protein EDB83DRAFT_2438222 [Lactarius deliciosus]
MSSPPSTQPQPDATTNTTHLSERKEIPESRRNHGQRALNPGGVSDSSNRNDTRRQRQNTGQRRRNNSRGPDATSLHPQSAPTRSQPNDRQRRAPHTARGRPANPQAQDQAAPSPGQRRRAARFNPALSEEPTASVTSKADAPAQSTGGNSSRRRTRAPPGDDLTSILTFALSSPPFPECMICFNPMLPGHPSWSCSPKEEKDAQSCWNTFHLKCIKPWAEKSVKDTEDAWRARGEERKGEWRCPGCQSKREIVPRKYWCFCGSTQDPKPPRLATPHSCGNSCARARVCGHPCPLPCHPGPCPPCKITIQNPCHCGKDTIALVCSRANPTSGGRGVLLANRSCGHKCGKTLSCQNHVCQDICHDGECNSCSITDLARCWCGKERKQLACGEGDDKECNFFGSHGEESWIGKFDCGNVCERLFDCGIHKCPKMCHPPSLTPPECPYSPLAVTHCPCGKRSLTDPATHHYFSKNAKLIRSACTDPVPTCTSPCGKQLDGCTHFCSATCHTGPCPPCIVAVVRPCRCGSTTRALPCSTTQAETDSTTFLCNKPCGSLRTCGHHTCTRLCCPLANLANPIGKGKKKAATNNIGSEVVDVDGWHQCDVVCGRMLSCGNHHCEERDHRGPCPPCFQSSFEELICNCGRTILEPPISCGTQIQCSYPCARPDPSCGHPKAPHLCHEDPTPCPPCVYLTEKLCACGKTMVGNIRCSSEKVSCGKPCGRPLGCGFHRCEQLCHGGACAPCTAICGKPRKLCLPAQHPCTQPCHAPSICPEVEPCTAAIIVNCPCGRIQQSVLCGRSATSPAGREAALVPRCTNECEIAKRNARLAEALGINPDLHKANSRQVVYSDELVAFAKPNVKFVELVEKTFAEFVTSDKRVHVLPSMPESKRKFVHDLAAVYRMDSQMVDREPHRSVQLIRRIDTRVPTNILSQSVATGSTLGKLADLRAPARTALPTPTPAGSGSSKVGRGWNSVLAPAPQASSNLSALTGPNTPRSTTPSQPASGASSWATPGASRSATPLPVPSQPVAAAATAAPSSSEAVPDNWEDDDV